MAKSENADEFSAAMKPVITAMEEAVALRSAFQSGLPLPETPSLKALGRVDNYSNHWTAAAR